jgi:hypothetical protein
VLSPVPANVVYGTPFSLTATVSSPYTGVPVAGYVQFSQGTSKLGPIIKIAGGAATLNTGSRDLIAGTYSITAKYLGSVVFLESDPTAAQTVTITPAATAVTAGSAPAPNGGVVFSGTVQNLDTALVPAGTVQVLNGSTVLWTAKLSSGGTWTTGALLVPAGTRLTVRYRSGVNLLGSKNFADSKTSLTV